MANAVRAAGGARRAEAQFQKSTATPKPDKSVMSTPHADGSPPNAWLSQRVSSGYSGKNATEDCSVSPLKKYPLSAIERYQPASKRTQPPSQRGPA
ncbi:unannotated protein [freshwater metagenome]|uniref:Unannotated protein n=1 Tax=freshwater metagenome TaxID=449393 RepID=A0A6J6SUL8_9ZZZZ